MFSLFSKMEVVHVFTLLLVVAQQYSSTTGYEDEGRLYSQYRVYRDDAVFPVDRYYCNNRATYKKFCSHDLRGYYIGCNSGWPKKNNEEDYRACAKGTRCGCHVDEECKLKEICVPVEVPPPIVGRATFRFTGTNENYYYEDGYTNEEEDMHMDGEDDEEDVWKREDPRWRVSKRTSGVVKQDTSEHKYLQLISHEGQWAKYFELIVPDEHGILTKYTGWSAGRHGRCEKKSNVTFQPFGVDIKNYHLIETKNNPNGTIQQTWEYRINYKFYTWVYWTWRWVISTDPKTNTTLPVTTYYENRHSSEKYEQPYKQTQNVRWTMSKLVSPWIQDDEWYTGLLGDNNSDWFRVPDFCK